jgi:hypothetical protein
MRFSKLAMVAILLSMAGLTGCEAGGDMDAQEIEQALAEGIDRQQVERFFQEHDIQYGFVTREESEAMIPRYQWKSSDAVGRYRGLIRDAKTKWWKLAREHISIDVEVDSSGKVTRVGVEPAYTAP